MTYTCQEYRAEMLLLGLKKRLSQEGLSEEEKKELLTQIEAIESEMGMD